MTSAQDGSNANAAIAVGVQEMPDGSKWVSLHISAATTTYVIAMTPEAADQVAPQLFEGLRDAAKAARKDNKASAIITPNTPKLELPAAFRKRT